MDDQLSQTSAKLVQARQNAQLSRRNLADSGALLNTMVTELQSLRGTFENMSQQVEAGDQRLEKFQGDIDFRLAEFDKRLSALEEMVAQLDIQLPDSQDSENVISLDTDSGKQIGAAETLQRAKKHFEAGDYKVTQAFLKEFAKRFPADSMKEEAEFLLGESYFRDGDPMNSIQAFQALIEDFPQSERIPTVMLRQGEAFLALGQKEDAKVFFNELERAYPKSAEAKKAQAHLEELSH
jgi:tol-pal system protein YbgF